MNQDHCLVEQFEMIFRTHFSSVKFFINMFLKSEADAEDLAQDVFTKLWTNFETWQNNDGKEGYIYAMAKNVAFDFIKHKRLENDYREEQIKKSTIKDLLGLSDPLNSLYYKEMQLIIRMALENFPERRRRIFEMSRFNSYNRASDIFVASSFKENHFNFIFPIFSLSSWNVSIVIYEIPKSNITIT